MSAATVISVINSLLLLGVGFVLGQLWRVIAELKRSTDALIVGLSEQGLIPPKKPNGAGRHRGTYV